MTRKLWTTIVLTLALGSISLYLNKDWFAKDNIQITHRSRAARAGLSGRQRPTAMDAVNPILFGFDRKLKLKLIQVIPVRDIETNKYPHPIWHLISKSNSVPVSDFTCGCSIGGMQPAVPGATPDPLEPGVTYRLLVEAGSLKLQDDFVPVARYR